MPAWCSFCISTIVLFWVNGTFQLYIGSRMSSARLCASLRPLISAGNAIYACRLLPGSVAGLPTTPHVTMFQMMDTQLTNSTRCSGGT